MKALFDFDFRKFVTPSIIKIVYVLIMVFLVVGYIGIVVTGFQANAAIGFLMLLIVGPLFVLVYLVLARAGLESLIAQIRTAENTAELVRLAGGTPPSEAATMRSPGGPPAPQGPTGPATHNPKQGGPGTGPTDGGDIPPANPYQK